MYHNVKSQFLTFVLNQSIENRKNIINIISRVDIDQNQKVQLIAALIKDIKYENYKYKNSYKNSNLYLLASVAESLNTY
jgi:hypothetical protein